eukprot:SAG11_NODE_3122_length_2670_cov_10.586153_1_plen_74_part_00
MRYEVGIRIRITSLRGADERSKKVREALSYVVDYLAEVTASGGFLHENLYTGYWHSGTVLFFFVLDLRTVCRS